MVNTSTANRNSNFLAFASSVDAQNTFFFFFFFFSDFV